MSETSLLELIGKLTFYLFCVYFLLKLLKGIYSCFLANVLGFGVKWKPTHNTWAVITGATDGIGREYANQLANIGYSLLLISRSDDKLQKTRSEILSNEPKCASIKTLAVDFTKPDIYESIESEIERLEDIDVLVNNVGMTFEIGEYFTKIPNNKQFITSLINVNIMAMTKMIHLVLPKMVNRNRGIIINISSLSATNPIPLLSLYSASKVYGDYLSRALQFEYQNKGIIIQSVLPAFVATKMANMRPSFFVPTAQQYVTEALKTVGIETQTYGYWTHKLIGFFQDCIVSNTIGSYYNSLNGFKKLQFYRNKYYKRNDLIDDFH